MLISGWMVVLFFTPSFWRIFSGDSGPSFASKRRACMISGVFSGMFFPSCIVLYVLLKKVYYGNNFNF